MLFPNPCCRCGFCCLMETCPIGVSIFGSAASPCPALTLGDDGAHCLLAGTLVPIDDGCCIKATAYKDGKPYDFASLPPEQKKQVARLRATMTCF